MKLFIIQRKDNTVPSFDCQLLVITEGVKTRGDECSPVGREMIARTPSAWPWKHGRDSLACMVTYGVIEKNESHRFCKNRRAVPGTAADCQVWQAVAVFYEICKPVLQADEAPELCPQQHERDVLVY